MPQRPQFPGQQRDEKVIFKKRRHWFILLQWLVPPVVLFLASVGVGFGIGLALSLTILPWAGLILLLCIGPLVFTIWRFLDWENDHYILTNQRVLHIERIYFLFESRKEANLDRVQDVTVRMPSLAANVLYFGDVEIETASTAGQIKFRSVPKPRKIQKQIFQQAGIPERDMQVERWHAGQMRILRPLEMLARMLYPVYPSGGGVHVWRKHWFILLTKLSRPLVATTLLSVVWVVLLFVGRPAALEFIPELAIIVGPGIFILFLIGWIGWITIDWHNDLYVLTDTHVLDIEKKPFTSEFRREANLGMIQNVSYEQPTFLSKFLDYGNTRLETAGRMGEFTFDSVPNPRLVQQIIIEHLAEFRRRNATGKPRPAPRTEADLEKAVERILSERFGLSPREPEEQS